MQITNYVFPKMYDYPNVLNVGTASNKPKDIKDVLFVMDVTGSMSDYINNNSSEGNKWTVAKNLISSIEAKGVSVKVLPFNITPHPVCEVNKIPEPNNSTYFSPLVPEIKKLFDEKNNYSAVVFMSDGLPSEDKFKAHQAIFDIGRLVRENNCNPVSVAIGNDADGCACAKFSGNRGYECFIRYQSQKEQVVDDIFNGIQCNYVMISNGSYIPIEKDGHYYYLSSNLDDDTTDNTTNVPDFDTVFKFINLVILDEFSKESPSYKNLVEFVTKVAEVETNLSKRSMLVNHFITIIGDVKKKTAEQNNTPSLLTATKQAYRNASQQV
jgi:hypothetical protein